LEILHSQRRGPECEKNCRLFLKKYFK
jgi:hypothetical protein